MLDLASVSSIIKEERSRKVEVEKSRAIKITCEEVIILTDHVIYIVQEGNECIAALPELPNSTLTLESHLTP